MDSKRILLGGFNFLKDYFFREYEKDSQPLSYATLHHSFNNSSLDLLLQKRTNRWYSQAEMLPQINYSLPSFQIGETTVFYFSNSGSYVNYNNKNAVPSDSFNDVTYNQLNTTNRFSLATKAAFINLNPFLSSQQIYYDKSTYGSTLQNSFSSGSDLSTKFYRIFDVKSNFLNLDINDLRHVITPSIGYSYNINATTPTREVRISRGNSTRSSSAALELSNKLQTKRNGQSVDFVDLRIASSYAFKPKTGVKRGSSLSDFLFELKILPYSWLRIDADTTYQHSGARADVNYKHFSNANYDINFEFDKEHSFGLGQRYQRKGGNEITYDINWRLSPKWKFYLYQRRNRGHQPGLKRGLREQEYSLSRDLHCWTVDFTYNVKRGEGEAIWLVFRLKAFPELEFEYNQQYHVPKPGSQYNP